MSTPPSKNTIPAPDRTWLLIALPAILTAVFFAGPYITFSFSRLKLNPNVPLHIIFLSVHGLVAGTALLIGPFQFVQRIRINTPRVHRLIGKTYFVAVSIGSVMALAATIVSTSGWSAQVGFVVLDAFWVYTAIQGYRTIRQGKFAEHRIWMIRNYSATFAAVILRIILVLEKSVVPLVGGHLPAGGAYDVSVWGSITGSIFVAELFIVNRSMTARMPARLSGSVPPT